MISPADMTRCYDMVTNQNAAILNLPDCALEVGKKASLMVLVAGNPIEAIRLRPEHLLVMAKGKAIARRNRLDTQLSLPGRPSQVNRRHTTS